jgi:hypothetical protein
MAEGPVAPGTVEVRPAQFAPPGLNRRSADTDLIWDPIAIEPYWRIVVRRLLRHPVGLAAALLLVAIISACFLGPCWFRTTLTRLGSPLGSLPHPVSICSGERSSDGTPSPGSLRAGEFPSP